MGLLRRSTSTPPRPAETVRAVASTATPATGSLAWFAAQAVGAGRAQAMALPTISRARDLIASLIASCPLKQFQTSWDPAAAELVEVEVEPEPWMRAPDPSTTRSWMLAWTFDDLFFHGRAHWRVLSRYSDGRAASFQLLPASIVMVESPLWHGNRPIGGIQSITVNGQLLEPRDVVSFWSPVESVLTAGRRALQSAERLDMAAFRFASTPAALGWLEQTGGEPLSADELAEIAEAWATARDSNTVGALNEFVTWKESQLNPSNLQLIESRQHAALDLARLANVPPYLVGIAVGGMTYTNAETSRNDLFTFGALPYVRCIEDTLSLDSVTPRGRIVRLDRDAWIPPALNDPNAATPATEVPA